MGTSYKHLQVLWISRCRLTDLDGLSCLPLIEEVYASYNLITHVTGGDELTTLDVEGNKISDVKQNIICLSCCDKLVSLNMLDNDIDMDDL